MRVQQVLSRAVLGILAAHAFTLLVLQVMAMEFLAVHVLLEQNQLTSWSALHRMVLTTSRNSYATILEIARQRVLIVQFEAARRMRQFETQSTP